MKKEFTSLEVRVTLLEHETSGSLKDFKHRLDDYLRTTAQIMRWIDEDKETVTHVRPNMHIPIFFSNLKRLCFDSSQVASLDYLNMRRDRLKVSSIPLFSLILIVYACNTLIRPKFSCVLSRIFFVRLIFVSHWTDY